MSASASADLTPQPLSDHAAGRGEASDHETLARYFAAEARRPARYAGQLDPAFQRRLAAWHANISEEDCDFYHTIALPDGRVIEGEWDLRGHETIYLGRESLAGRKVLEIGPASGWLSAVIARQAADLVVFDLPFGASPELVPHPDVDLEAARRSGAHSAARLRNSWWLARRALGFEARAVYGDIYELPPDIGRFDVTVMGSILLHLSNPFRALQSAAAVTDDTLIVTDVYSAPEAAAVGAGAPTLALFNVTPPPIGLVHWWSLGPAVIKHMLELLGFADITIETYTIDHMKSRPPMFTVVGHRRARKRASIRPIGRDAATAPDGFSVPSPEGRFLVAGTQDLSVFLELGRKGFTALSRSLEDAGVEMAKAGCVLDFGCGVGRVLRHWGQYPEVEIHGTDFQPALVDWCRENLPFGRFAVNPLEGPLAYASGQFDIIYALSVFTHLPRAMQAFWFRELLRILRPGGLLYFTTHGAYYRHLLDEKQRSDFDSGGLIEAGIDQPGTNICTIFHPLAWVKAEFMATHEATLIEFLPCGARGNPEQDSYLVRKKV